MARTIRFRMTLWYAALLLGGFITLGTLVYGNVQRQVFADLDTTLRARAEFVTRFLRSKRSGPDFSDLRHEIEEHSSPHTIGELVEIRRGNATVLRSVNMGDAERLPLPRGAVQSRIFRKHAYRVLATSASGFRIIVASPEQSERRLLQRLLLTFTLVAPIVVVFASIAGWFLAGRMLQPVGALTRRANAIRASDLSTRVEVPETRDEIAHLAETFNAMLARLDAAFAQQRQFTADASHELRTPLTAMRSEVEVALRKQRSSEEYQRSLAKLLGDIAHVNKIVDDLFTLSQADAGRLTLEASTANIEDLVRDVTERYAPVAENKGVALTSETQSVTLRADKARLQQLLFNLIDNAVKYTPTGGKVNVAVALGDGNCEIRVSDTGIGIPAEHLPKIFDRFYRVDRARSREQGGSGLGLSICRWIAEAHGGRIRVESAQERGTSFTVELPIQD